MPSNQDIVCTNGRVTALRVPNGPQRVKIPEGDWTSRPLEHSEVTKMVSVLQIYNYSGLPHSIIS